MSFGIDLPVLAVLSYVGVFVFALSGGLAAARKNMDMFGVVAVAILPGIGGGTIRDVILGAPVFWLSDPFNVIAAILAGLTTILFAGHISRSKFLIWFDAMGLALFAATGAAISINLGYGGVVAVMMGTITATCGGLMRDIVCMDIPLVLQKDIYALAAIVGALAYWIGHLFGLPQDIGLMGAAALAFIVRALAIRFHLSLPSVPGL